MAAPHLLAGSSLHPETFPTCPWQPLSTMGPLSSPCCYQRSGPLPQRLCLARERDLVGKTGHLPDPVASFKGTWTIPLLGLVTMLPSQPPCPGPSPGISGTLPTCSPPEPQGIFQNTNGILTSHRLKPFKGFPVPSGYLLSVPERVGSAVAGHDLQPLTGTPHSGVPASPLSSPSSLRASVSFPLPPSPGKPS